MGLPSFRRASSVASGARSYAPRAGGSYRVTDAIAEFQGSAGLPAPAPQRSLPLGVRAARRPLARRPRIGPAAVHLGDPNSTPLLMGLTHSKKIVTCHDAIPARYPSRYFGIRDGGAAVGLAIEKRRYRTADLVIAISDATRETPSRISVCPRAHRSRVQRRRRRSMGRRADRAGRAGARALRPRESRVRSLRRRERLAQECRGDARWVRPGAKERDRRSSRVGRQAARGARAERPRPGREFRRRRRPALLGFVGDDDLSVLFRAARAHVLVSWCEGFGLTVVEAMAAGCPVVTTKGGSLGEVAGDAALTVEPDDHGGDRRGHRAGRRRRGSSRDARAARARACSAVFAPRTGRRDGPCVRRSLGSSGGLRSPHRILFDSHAARHAERSARYRPLHPRARARTRRAAQRRARGRRARGPHVAHLVRRLRHHRRHRLVPRGRSLGISYRSRFLRMGVAPARGAVARGPPRGGRGGPRVRPPRDAAFSRLGRMQEDRHLPRPHPHTISRPVLRCARRRRFRRQAHRAAPLPERRSRGRRERRHARRRHRASRHAARAHRARARLGERRLVGGAAWPRRRVHARAAGARGTVVRPLRGWLRLAQERRRDDGGSRPRASSRRGARARLGGAPATGSRRSGRSGGSSLRGLGFRPAPRLRERRRISRRSIDWRAPSFSSPATKVSGFP